MKKQNFKDGRDTVFLLFFFSLVLGVELGGLSQNLNLYGSAILIEPLFSIMNLIWFFVGGTFIFFSVKENIWLHKIVYFLGGATFFLTDTIINVIGYKSLYGLKILILFTVTVVLMRHLQKNAKYLEGCSSEKIEEVL